MFSWRSKKQLLPPHITQEIAQVFSENYYYAKQVDFTVFLNRFGGKKCTVQQLKGGIDELKCDPYTGLGVITGGERFAPPDYMDFLDGTFYWKLNHFGEIEWVIRHIKGGNYSHIIIDLADNWGGSIRNMLRIAELLVPAKELLCLRYRENTKTLCRTSDAYIEIPRITLLVSERTMSSGEILAYILKEYHGDCHIIGRKMYGKEMGQITWTNSAYKLRFSVTAFQWLVNGLSCLQLQQKYDCEWIDAEYDREEYIIRALMHTKQ